MYIPTMVVGTIPGPPIHGSQALDVGLMGRFCGTVGGAGTPSCFGTLSLK